MRLFRNSSFVWRLNGEADKETKYAKYLSSMENADEKPRELLFEHKYFGLRRIVLLVKEEP